MGPEQDSENISGAVFLVVGFLVTGYFLLSALDIILFLFMIDFVAISISTDSMHGSKNSE